MEPRNLDARDLEAMAFAPLELHPVPPLPPPPPPAAPDPELPTTLAELRNVIRFEVFRVLSTVPQGEA